MKIEKINENKIKVTLSLNDLQERNIDLSALSYNSPQAQKLFVDMMNVAESEHGFLVGDSQIFIEALPTPPEGFEIIVTKVEDDKEFESIHKYIKNRLKRSDLSTKKRNKKIAINLLIYSFETFEDLCLCAKHIKESYTGSGSLYKYNNYFYLVLSKNCIENIPFDSIKLFLDEYGEMVSTNSSFEGFLYEHGEKLIEENAVQIITNYF